MAVNRALVSLVFYLWSLCVIVATTAAAESSLPTCRLYGFDAMGKLVKFKVSNKFSDTAMMMPPEPKANTAAAKTAVPLVAMMAAEAERKKTDTAPMAAMKDAKSNKMAAEARPRKTAAAGLAGFVAWPPDLGLACQRASTALHRRSSTACNEPVMGGGVAPGSFHTKDFPWGTGATWWVPAARWTQSTASWAPPPQQSATLLRPGGHARFLRAQHTSILRSLLGPDASRCGVSVPLTIASHVQGLIGGDEGTQMMQPANFYYHVFLFSSFLQPWVLWSHTTVRQLLLGHCLDESAITWVLGSSFLYLRRRHQQDPSVVGMFRLRQLLRPIFNRRFARSVHPGACVFDAPAYTPHRHDHLPQRLSRRCYLLFWSQDLYVIRSFLKDLYVIWLL